MLLVHSSMLIRVQIVKRGRWGKERRVGRWLGVCSSLPPIAMTKPMSKSTAEREGFISIFQLTVYHEGNSGQERTQARNLEAGIATEVMEEHCLLACSLFFLIQCRITCPGEALPAGSYSHPHQSLIKKTLWPCPQASLMEVPSSQMLLARSHQHSRLGACCTNLMA